MSERYNPHPEESIGRRTSWYNPDYCRQVIYWPNGEASHQCRRRPQEGGEYCWQHQPERVEERRQAMIKRREEHLDD